MKRKTQREIEKDLGSISVSLGKPFSQETRPEFNESIDHVKEVVKTTILERDPSKHPSSTLKNVSLLPPLFPAVKNNDQTNLTFLVYLAMLTLAS